MTDKRVRSSGLQTKTTGCMNLERTGTLSLFLFGRCGDVSVHLAGGAFNESERSGQRQEDNPEELEGTARLMLTVCVRGPREHAVDSAAH